MYKYKIYNKLSTSLTKIIDEDTNDHIGYIQKNYSNIFTRSIDLIGDGKFFNSFKVYNKNKDYELHKNIGESAYIINIETNQRVARWKNPLTSPLSNYFELLDESLDEYKLLFLGIFHTYLYGE